MKPTAVRVIVDIDEEVQFSRCQKGLSHSGVNPICFDTVLAVKQSLEYSLAEVNDLIPNLKAHQTCLEIKLDGQVVFSHAVPVEGTPYGVATNDTATNLKIKNVLESALNQVDITLKSNS